MVGQKILKVYFTDHFSVKERNNVPISGKIKEVVVRGHTCRQATKRRQYEDHICSSVLFNLRKSRSILITSKFHMKNSSRCSTHYIYKYSQSKPTQW
jgi:hypothetical protein